MIVFDVSRLIARARKGTPTGIDRVEFAYARHLLSCGRRVCFVRSTWCAGLVPLPDRAIGAYLDALGAFWQDGRGRRRGWRLGWAALRLRRLPHWRRELKHRLGAAAQPVYLLVSHFRLEQSRRIAALKRRYSLRFVCLIHDTIPVDFPEYARPGHDRRHRRRLASAAALADAVVVPSDATAKTLRPHIAAAGRSPRLLKAPFGPGLDPAGTIPPVVHQLPFFVCLGTIEARKNHLLLLTLWRDLTVRDRKPPTLFLIGQRGWECENALDLLDRCPALRGIVFEQNRLCDRETARLVKGARALLLPSFAEGFGFPLIEALTLGTPVLAADLPALREIGGDVPEYLDPLDGPSWRAAICDYAVEPSPRRTAQLARLGRWPPPRWQDHFAAVEALLAGDSLLPRVCAGGPAGGGARALFNSS